MTCKGALGFWEVPDSVLAEGEECSVKYTEFIEDGIDWRPAARESQSVT